MMRESSLIRRAIKDSHARFPRNLALTYCAISVLWILFSDAALFAFKFPASLTEQISAYKGLFFVALTSILIFDISRRYLKRADDALRKSIESSHELIERLVVAGEFRDDDTGNHAGLRYSEHHLGIELPRHLEGEGAADLSEEGPVNLENSARA